MVELTLTHWAYLAGVLAIILAMILRRGVVLIATVGLFLIGLLYTGNLVSSIQIVFNSYMSAGTSLFDIMLVIALMVGMLKSMETMGADYLMVAPIKRVMKKPVVSFFLIGFIMYIAALFFWPTPATALVGVILVPVAVKAGLPPMAAAMSVNILGHGMALAGDMFLQGAPNITASSADVDINLVLTNTAILSITTGVVAILVAFFMIRKEIIAGTSPDQISQLTEAKPQESYSIGARFMAVAVPVVFVSLVVVMILTNIRGGASTALLGGTAAMFIVISSFLGHGDKALEKLADYLREGLMFSVKIFSAVIPIAGFFFLGAPANAAVVLGEGAPGFLFDLGTSFANALPLSKIPVALGIVTTGVITGLDGSGFSGLPLVGSLANALGTPLALNVPVLAALGQVGAVFSGGGTITAWAFGLVATAGVAGVSPIDLARKNFIPVMCGLAASTILAIILM